MIIIYYKLTALWHTVNTGLAPVLFVVALCRLGNFHDFFVICKFTFSKHSFRITIRVSQFRSRSGPYILLGLIWVHTICQGYQQTALAGKELMFPYI